jgi:hypothetical protein
VHSQLPVYEKRSIFMKGKIVIDGNAFYEIDEECMKRKQEMREKEQERNDRKRRENKKESDSV